MVLSINSSQLIIFESMITSRRIAIELLLLRIVSFTLGVSSGSIVNHPINYVVLYQYVVSVFPVELYLS